MEDLMQELRIKIMSHKLSVLGAVLMKEFIDDHTSMGSPNFPDFMLRELASEYTNNKIQASLEDGSFNKKYESAWKKLVKFMPDNANFSDLVKPQSP